MVEIHGNRRIIGSVQVNRFGLRLMPRMFKRLNPMTFDEACAMERRLVERLRRKGFAVWQK